MKSAATGRSRAARSPRAPRASSRPSALAKERIGCADASQAGELGLEVHQSLITLLATQSPVATDLRLISALLHVLKNVERMGDQCVNICKVEIRLVWEY